MWTIDSLDDPDMWQSNTLVKIHLPTPERVKVIPLCEIFLIINFNQVAMRYEAILACEGLAINGTGHQIVRAKKVGY